MFFKVLAITNIVGTTSVSAQKYDTYDAAKKACYADLGRYVDDGNVNYVMVSLLDERGGTMMFDSWKREIEQAEENEE